MERNAILWEKLDNNRVKCAVCENRCIIPEGKIARCFSRYNDNGEMKLNTYNMVSSIVADPIEKKPVYNYRQGTKVMSVGSWGCNFSCMHCQNWEISQMTSEIKSFVKQYSKDISPEMLSEFAKENSCEGVAWTYNEPCIWLEYTIDCAKIAKSKGLYTVYVTNGYITPEGFEQIAPYLDVYRVDFKSFDDEFYQKICGVKSAKPVYVSALQAKKAGKHVECVTNIIPGYNDSEENLKNIAEWIFNNLGSETPWHVTRFFPYYRLSHLEPTPLETIEKARQIGIKAGLKFVYKGNV